MAIYGGLCALATFDRQELQRNVISSRWVGWGLSLQSSAPSWEPGSWSCKGGRCGAQYPGTHSSFKLFLELEPQIRDIIFKFYESKYASCLKMLDEMKVGARAWPHRGLGLLPGGP